MRLRIARMMIALVVVTFMLALVCFSGCDGDKEYNESLPTFKEEDGWYQTLNNDFSKYSSIEEVYENTPWAPSPHGRRNTEYWCSNNILLDKEEGVVRIVSAREDNHDCDVCGVTSGVFTGGIETGGSEYNDGFKQAFGYFEAVVKVPDSPGMWSAFWLQSSGTGKIGNKGVDGTEIDIYESSFHQKNRTTTGNALHYDAYNAPWYRCIDHTKDVGYDLYDGNYHKYALLWTPEKYVFYVDDKPVWVTDGGGVSCVEEYLRLTVEIRDTKYGPYGQQIGQFVNKDDGSTDFEIKSVSVWQNSNFEQYIRDNSYFKDMKDTYTIWLNVGITLAVALVLVAVGLSVYFIIRKKRNAKKDNA